MNELASALFAIVEGVPRSKLDQLEWEMLPNEVRNRPRICAPGRPVREPVVEMTAEDWEAWGL